MVLGENSDQIFLVCVVIVLPIKCWKMMLLPISFTRCICKLYILNVQCNQCEYLVKWLLNVCYILLNECPCPCPELRDGRVQGESEIHSSLLQKQVNEFKGISEMLFFLTETETEKDVVLVASSTTRTHLLSPFSPVLPFWCNQFK